MGLVRCSFCHQTYDKDNRHIKENSRLTHKFFCSPFCLSAGRNKHIALNCESCNRVIFRAPAAISLHNFCSHSCSAKFTNTVRLRKKLSLKVRRKISIPRRMMSGTTDKTIRKRKPYQGLSPEELRKARIASGKKAWLNFKSVYTKEYIIFGIQKFFSDHKRIPLKRELNRFYRPSRRHFGTWNNAIIAAGFKPNPVLFAEHHIAKDGHKCDSIAEMIIDDYFYKRQIKHERCCSYPEGTYTVDFKINNYFIEFFGLAGEHKRYDELRAIKQKLAIKHKLKLIEIYPNDLYPIHKLDTIFQAF